MNYRPGDPWTNHVTETPNGILTEWINPETSYMVRRHWIIRSGSYCLFDPNNKIVREANTLRNCINHHNTVTSLTRQTTSAGVNQ